MKIYELRRQIKGIFIRSIDRWLEFEKTFPNWSPKFLTAFAFLLFCPLFARGIYLIIFGLIDVVLILIFSSLIDMQVKKRVAVFVTFGVPIIAVAILIWALVSDIKTAFSAIGYAL